MSRWRFVSVDWRGNVGKDEDGVDVTLDFFFSFFSRESIFGQRSKSDSSMSINLIRIKESKFQSWLVMKTLSDWPMQIANLFFLPRF